MIRGYKYRLKPNKEQADKIKRTIGCARFIYNILFEDYKEQLNNRTEGVPIVIKNVSEFKGEYEFLKEIDSLALANSKQNLRAALSNFFNSRNGKRKGKKIKLLSLSHLSYVS